MRNIVVGLIVLVLSFFVVISCTQEQVQNAEPENNPLIGIWSVQTDVALPEDWFVES